jgi:hypothetical protein
MSSRVFVSLVMGVGLVLVKSRDVVYVVVV